MRIWAVGIDALRVAFLSWECAIALAMWTLWLTYPSILAQLGRRVIDDGNLLPYILALPGVILIWATTQAKAVLAPASAAQNVQLRAWPDYWRLKIRVLLGLAWIVASCCISLVTWIFRADFASDVVGSLLTTALIVSVFSAGSLWLASITVREIVEK